MTHHILILIISLLLSPSHYHYHNNHFNIFIDTTGQCSVSDSVPSCTGCKTACRNGIDTDGWPCGEFCFKIASTCDSNCDPGYR